MSKTYERDDKIIREEIVPLLGQEVALTYASLGSATAAARAGSDPSCHPQTISGFLLGVARRAEQSGTTAETYDVLLRTRGGCGFTTVSMSKFIKVVAE